MSNTIVKVSTVHQIFSPFSGLPADGEDGPNEKDPTLLFVCYGGMCAYHPLQFDLNDFMGSDIDYLLSETNTDGMFIFEVDSGWGGLNHYCFAPVENPTN